LDDAPLSLFGATVSGTAAVIAEFPWAGAYLLSGRKALGFYGE
jgi:hypothetical protein